MRYTDMYFDNYPNRTLCDVLNEMRKACKTLNFSYMKGLIEEVQTLGNRMEAKLSDYKDFNYNLEQKKELEEELKLLQKQKKNLERDTNLQDNNNQ